MTGKRIIQFLGNGKSWQNVGNQVGFKLKSRGGFAAKKRTFSYEQWFVIRNFRENYFSQICSIVEEYSETIFCSEKKDGNLKPKNYFQFSIMRTLTR